MRRFTYVLLVLSLALPYAGSAAEVALPDKVPMESFALEAYPSYDELQKEIEAGVTDKDWDIEGPRLKIQGSDPACGYQYAEVYRDYCTFGNPSATRTIAVFGSSYAQTFMPALHGIGTAYDWKVFQFTKPGCTPIRLDLYNFRGAYPECTEWREWAIATLIELKPDVIVMDGNWDSFAVNDKGTAVYGIKTDLLATGLQATLVPLVESGTRVVVLGTIPKGDIAYDCLLANLDDATKCQLDLATSANWEWEETTKQVTTESGAHFVNLMPLFCTDQICPAIVMDTPTHQDNYHVSEIYAFILRDVIYKITGISELDAAP